MLPSETWRAPGVRLLVNGQAVAGVVEAEVRSNNYLAADRFSASIALGADLTASPAFWSAAQGISVDLQFSLDATAFQSVLQGLVDTVAIEPAAALVRIEGRDFTAGLIDTRTQESFSNRTSSEIATLLADRHGLVPAVTPTTTPVGRYYQDQHDRITLDQFSRATTEWDLLTYLARQEGFDVFVQGTTLYFAPAQQQSDVRILRPADCMDLRLQRSLTLARDIEVTVKSWNSRQQTAKAARRAGQSGGQSGLSQPPQQYVLVRPNLTPDQALQLAQRKLAELTQLERVIEATMPGELSLTPRSVVTLAGTSTDFDQTYFVDVLERSINPHAGFVQRIRAKNTSPRTETTIPADTVGAVAEP